MALIASGINKRISYKRQSALGTIATGSGAQYLRRITSNIDLKKATYQSNEIKPSQQVSDFRHGVRGVEGTIAGEMSVGTYQDLIESMVRQDVLTSVTTTAILTVTSAATTANMGTFTRSAGSYFTDGFKVGMVLRWSGWATTGVSNNAKNMVIIALTATVMTCATLDGTAVSAKAAGDSVTGLEVGKHTFVPATAHTRDYYTIEHYFGDIVQSEVFSDCVVSQVDVKLPATGMATIDLMIKGLNMTPGTTEYFTTPTAVTTGRNLAAVNGVLYVAGAAVALITGLNFSIKGGHTMIGGVVGSNVEPDIFPGKVSVDGQATVLFIDGVFRNYFVNETEVSMFCVFTTDNTATSGFTGFTFPRVKMGGAGKDDGEKGLVLTMPFVALENDTGGTGTNSFATTVVIQDSAFV